MVLAVSMYEGECIEVGVTNWDGNDAMMVSSANNSDHCYEVTHWMYLPSLPKC